MRPSIRRLASRRLIPNLAHPLLLFRGEHGAAKTTSGRRLLALVDPTPGATRTPPRDIEGWAVAAAASWAVLLDNLSSILAWLLMRCAAPAPEMRSSGGSSTPTTA